MSSYEQSRQLHHLRNQDFLEYGKIVPLFGGCSSHAEVERHIDAFEDMNECNRNDAIRPAFKAASFSFFVALQKPRVKDAIYAAGFDLEDFAGWLRDGRISSDSQVGDLIRVLPDHEARNVFLSGGGAGSIEAAVRLIDGRRNPEGTHANESPALQRLARSLIKKVNDLKFSEILEMKNEPSGALAENLRALRALDSQLKSFLRIFPE